MVKIILIIAFTGLMTAGNASNFFDEKIDKRYHYVVLANPTVNNLEIIRFLVDKKIFKVNLKNTKFVGVYHKNQFYDFQKSREYIEANAPDDFFLHEVTGKISGDNVFKENECTAEFRKIFRNSSGILFFGGPDIQPEIYGEQNTRSVVTDPARHLFEVSLLFHLLGSSVNPGVTPLLNEKPDYLVTGFCLGLQAMNVATGGTLVQDIPFEIYGKTTPQETVTIDRNNLHRNYQQELNDDKQLMGINFHPINFTEHPFFGKIIKVPKNFHPLIYSSHHQSLEKIGTGFEVTALSPDGKVVEGLAHRKFHNVFGVQFHPEVNALYEDRELWKFAPGDEPRTYHRIIGKKSVNFHKKYWKHISDCLKQSVKKEAI